jgi:IS1 family transposase
MNRLNREERAKILQMMAEGVSLRAISRMTGISRNTGLKLVADAGQAFAAYQDKAFRNLPCKRLQVDEIWSFTYAKDKNVRNAKAAPDGAGDTWTFTAIDADTKLVMSWLVGARDSETAYNFMYDLSERLANRVQLTSDGLRVYIEAVWKNFGENVDFGQLVKLYGLSPDGQRRYSPAECIGAIKHPVFGDPDAKHISTSFAERQNLNMRMGMRRFTRLTNAFSKKIENHIYAVAIYFMHYNFVRIHQTLKITPAMAAGVTDKLWEMSDMVKVLEDWEAGN